MLLNNFKLLEFKGKGTTAEVWSAYDIDNNINVALKIFAPDIALDNSSKILIRREYENTKKLEHPYIINPIDHFEYEGVPVLVFRLCKHSLWEELKVRISRRLQYNNTDRKNLFTENELSNLIYNISDALVYLHNSKMIHHDVKPANILISEEGGKIEFHLSDFGITKEIKETIIRQTKLRSNSLTLAYAAPERLRGGYDNLPQSDIFSFGATIYELTNSIKMPPGEILNNNGTLENIKGDYSDRFKELIKACLEKDYNKRIGAKKLLNNSIFYINNRYWPESIGLSSNQETKVQNPSEEVFVNNEHFDEGNQNETIRFNDNLNESIQDDENPNETIRLNESQNKSSGFNEYQSEITNFNGGYNEFHSEKIKPSFTNKFFKLILPILFLIGLGFLINKYFIQNNIKDVKSRIECKNGYQLIQLNTSKCGIIDKDGQWIKNPIYDNVINKGDSIILLKNNEKSIFLIK